MTAKGTLFDFSGTFFRAEPAERWLRAGLDTVGLDLAPPEFARALHELQVVGAQPGGTAPRDVPAQLAAGWRVRDLSGSQHRAAHFAQAARSACSTRDSTRRCTSGTRTRRPGSRTRTPPRCWPDCGSAGYG